MENVGRKVSSPSVEPPERVHRVHWWMPGKYEPYDPYPEYGLLPILSEYPEHQSVQYIQATQKKPLHDSEHQDYKSHQV